MAVTAYSYTKEVDIRRLKKEILVSSIVHALEGIDFTEGSNALEIRFKDAISAGDKTTLDGIVSSHVPTPLGDTDPVDSEGRPEVIVREPTGTVQSFPSHNFTDPTTWYGNSLEVIGETPLTARAGFYVLANKRVIDVNNGKIAFEEPDLSSYRLRVYDGGVELEENTDYSCDHKRGLIIISDSYTVTGAVTADYHYAVGSSYRVTPDPTKGKLYITSSEVQFSGDIRMRPIEQNIIVDGTVVECVKFKNIDNFIDVGRHGTGTVSPVDTVKTGRWVFPFIYDPAIELDPALNMELEFVLPDDIEMSGERGTVTVYGKYLS